MTKTAIASFAIGQALRIIKVKGGCMEREFQNTVALSDREAALAGAPELASAFAEELVAIEALAVNRPERIGDLRRRMDAACDVGDMTIREWRALIEQVAAARAEAPLARPRTRTA